jgi:hypothetical protein
MPATVAVALKNGTFSDAAQQQAFDDYYTKYALPRWRRPTTITQLPRYRYELRTELYRAKRGEVHDHLVGLVFTELRKYIQDGQDPPATRYNAMLMIGDLNVTEAPRYGQAPVAHPDALQDLLKAVAPGANDPRLSEALRAAAMIGLIRHARIGIPGDQQPAVSTAMLGYVGATTTPGPAGEGPAWIRGQAAEVLGLLGSVGQNGTVAAALTGMVADKQLPFSARCKAAEALGKLNYAGAQVDVPAAATALGQLALDACNAEKTAGAKADTTYRRRLLQRVGAALAGVNALTAAGPAQGNLAQEVEQALKEVLDAVGDRSVDDTQLLSAMTAGYDKLTKLFP